MIHEVFGFVDGENLVIRYEDMLKNGSIPDPDVIHIPGFLVWHPELTKEFLCNYNRISFYQTFVGSNEDLDKARGKVCDIRYEFQEELNDDVTWDGSLFPQLFKKGKRAQKTKSVDINLTVDVLRCLRNNSCSTIFLLSGDGDYLPVLEEVGRHGKQLWLGAFSKGLNSNLRFAADEFIDLDSIFFKKPRAVTSRKKTK